MDLKIIELINEGSCSLAAFDGKEYYIASGLGVKPIITPMKDNLEFFKDKEVADIIIGKAAASLLVLSGVRAVYGKVMSKPAVDVFLNYGIEFKYGTLVEYILNREGNGMCPLESAVKDETDLNASYEKIKKTILELMRNK